MAASFKLMAELISDLRVRSLNPQQRVPWGITSLDALTDGPAPGEVFTVLGRSYSGKSMVATNILLNNEDHGIVLFSLEMPAHQVLTRLYSTWSGIDHHEVLRMVRQGTLPSSFDEMGEALERHLIVDSPRLTFGDMSVWLSAYEDYFGERPVAVIIDYLELIGGAKGSGAEGIEKVAGSLKDWAKQESVAVWVMHQTNKSEPEWLPPTSDSARYAGFTESDVVVGMWVPSRDPNLGPVDRERQRNEVMFTVLKNRINGRHNRHPIRAILRDDLRIVDLSAREEGDKR